MAMTKAELAKQLEALQAQYDSMDDEDEEVWVKVDGAEFKLTGAKAKTFLNKHKSHWEEVVEDVQDETEVEIAKPPRKTAAKKTSAPRKTAKPVTKELEEELDEIDDILEEEAEEVSPRRFF